MHFTRVRRSGGIIQTDYCYVHYYVATERVERAIEVDLKILFFFVFQYFNQAF